MTNLSPKTNSSVIDSILEGERTPRGFLLDKENRIKLITKFFELCGETADYNDAKKHNILGMINKYYKGSLSLAYQEISEKKDKEEIFTEFFEGKKLPYNFFESKENRIYFIKSFLKRINKNPEDVKASDFKKAKLWNLLNYHYQASTKKMIEEVFPDVETFKLPRLPKDFWEDKEQRVKASRYIIEDKLQIWDEDKIKKLSFKKLLDAGMNKNLIKFYKNKEGLQTLIQESYPTFS